MTTRAALYLDNVFSGLLKLDPEVAIRFAEVPSVWLGRLSMELTVSASRRWLVLRCYLNPDGAVPHPAREGERLHFSRIRRHSTQAGFEIVDCPRLGYTKNAADIRMVMDALDALRAPAAYDGLVGVRSRRGIDRSGRRVHPGRPAARAGEGRPRRARR